MLGRGIHPPTSTICGSAIADGAMPKSGGCVGIGKLNGQSGYSKAKDTNSIKIETASGAEWSYVVFKVDNPDFAKSDIRILVITRIMVLNVRTTKDSLIIKGDLSSE